MKAAASEAATVDVYLFPVFTTGWELDYNSPFDQVGWL